MEELLRKSKTVKRGATLEEAEIDGAWLTAYARIARRCRDDKDLSVSRYPYELVLCAAKDETSVEVMRPLLNSWAECSVVISC
jgi:hypothetical protein